MKAIQKNSALDGIKKEQLKRRVFTLEFEAEVVFHKKAVNLTLAECGRKYEVLPKLVQHWETQYDAGQLTVAAGRRAVSPEKAEITRLRAELSRAKMEVRILKKPWCTLQKRASEVHLYPRRTDDVTMSVVCPMLGVTQSGFHFWRRREPSMREQERERLSVEIRGVFDANRGRYGAPRIHKAMCERHGYTGSLN